jgi:hypothetical protein
MAFRRNKTLDGVSNPFEYYLLTDAEGATEGEALVLTSGRLTKCSPTATPEFISLKTQAAETTSTKLLPVVRVREDDEYITTSTVALTATNVGSKFTLHTDGTQVTNTTTSGVFAVSGLDGTKVYGYFRR